MTRALAIDTSTPACAVAVLDGERVLAEDDSASEGRHGEVLLPRVKSVLDAAGVQAKELELIAVGIGPGSFTGLRIGLASAKGLAIATVCPLRAVCSLHALAAGLPRDAGGALHVAALDAGKGELFVAAFEGDDPLAPAALEPLRATPADAAERLAVLAAARSRPLRLCGPGVRRHPELAAALGKTATLADPAFDAPRGRHVARLGLALFAREGASDLATLAPSYLRDSDAKLPDQKLRVD